MKFQTKPLRIVDETQPGSSQGDYRVNAEVLRQSCHVPHGQFCVDAEALRQARSGVPRGEFHVDAEALRKARQGVPRGEFHVDFKFLRRKDGRRDMPRSSCTR